MLLVLALPVHMSVLAPVEIVPRDPLVVSAPMDGVVRTIHVAPSQAVTKGTLLFSLDDTRLRNEHQVAVKALEVGRAKLNRARQKAFMDARSKADLNLLAARVRQKTVEAAYWEELLSKSRILAERDGIVVFGDPGDWEGRPVAVGEKVMTIADPKAVEARIELPVEDAIVLAPGARVLIFLNIRPQDPYPAVLVQSGYKAVITQDEVLAFSLKAALSAEKNTPRIGLRGHGKTLWGRGPGGLLPVPQTPGRGPGRCWGCEMDLLPPLREDLQLFQGPALGDGSPTWTLQDPVRNLFFRLGRQEFEILARWALGRGADLVSAIRRETTLEVTAAEIDALAEFLQRNQLMSPEDPNSRSLLRARLSTAAPGSP